MSVIVEGFVEHTCGEDKFDVVNVVVLKFSQFQTRMAPSRCRRIWRKYRLWKIFLVMLMPLFAVLHLIVLPSVSGGYNDECYLPDEKRQTLRIMVQNISRAFDQFGVVYWLDYGTLLGAYHTGDILHYDHDADISFLLSSDPSQAFRELNKYGINANGLVAGFQKMSLDFCRWKAMKSTSGGKTEVLLHKFYPASVRDNVILRYHRTLESFPLSWVVPTVRINFQGVDVAIPNSADRLLAYRYPWTYGVFKFQFPYKWKCWVPCWIRNSNGC